MDRVDAVEPPVRCVGGAQDGVYDTLKSYRRRMDHDIVVRVLWLGLWSGANGERTSLIAAKEGPVSFQPSAHNAIDFLVEAV